MASDDTSRVDALLREFRRPAAEPKTFGGAGRKLQDNGPRQIVGAAAADVDASMAWMEQRVKQLDMLAAEQQQERDALPSQRKPKAAPRTSAHTSVNDSTIAELASMERELRQATMRLQAESARAAALRAQLAAASVDASAVASADARACGSTLVNLYAGRQRERVEAFDLRHVSELDTLTGLAAPELKNFRAGSHADPRNPSQRLDVVKPPQVRQEY
jgi:hypothetical protein